MLGCFLLPHFKMSAIIKCIEEVEQQSEHSQAITHVQIAAAARLSSILRLQQVAHTLARSFLLGLAEETENRI